MLIRYCLPVIIGSPKYAELPILKTGDENAVPTAPPAAPAKKPPAPAAAPPAAANGETIAERKTGLPTLFTGTDEFAGKHTAVPEVKPETAVNNTNNVRNIFFIFLLPIFNAKIYHVSIILL
jgi:hypothetical protein